MRIALRIALAASAALLALGTAQAQEKALKIGTEGAYPPFNNLTADGKLEGFDIDIAQALCDEMKAKCEFVTQDWDGIIPALQAGKFDAIVASMSITDERKQQVDFTDPYYTNSLIVIAPKDSAIEAPTAEGLAGKVLGAQGSTVGAAYVTENFKDTELKPYPTQQELYLDIGTGRVDAAIGDVGVMGAFLKSEDGACCKQIGDAFAKDDRIGIAVRKGEQELIGQFNTAIAAIRANGVYKQISEKYFGTDIFE